MIRNVCKRLALTRRIGPAAVLLLVALPAVPLYAQQVEPAPSSLAGVGIDEKLESAVPRELKFRDEDGRVVPLGDFFDGERPVLLSMTYSNCPMLCHLQLDALVETLRNMRWSPGEQFQIVNVSIDPKEKPERAKMTKQKHLEAYGRPETAAGWHFLVGEEANVRGLADAVGFRYRYVAERNEYAHAAAMMLCTPDGRLSRYLYGVNFEPETLRLSLVEASEGKIGSTLDQILLFCFHYDAEARRYGLAARRLMQFGAGLTLFVLVVGLVPFWMRRSRKVAGSRSELESDTSGAETNREGTGDDRPEQVEKV